MRDIATAIISQLPLHDKYPRGALQKNAISSARDADREHSLIPVPEI